MWKRVVLAINLFILAPLIAGLYGIVHDQFTYSISPEYYTKFKFIQFELTHLLEQDYSERALVMITGWRATWWVGLPIGVVIGGFSLRYRQWERGLGLALRGFFWVVLIAFATGLLGLLYGYAFLPAKPDDWLIPHGVEAPRRFVMVGSMHNFSYLGGLLGLIVAGFWMARKQ